MPGPDILVDLYTRVSTDMQAEEGYSLAEQQSRLQLYAESQGWKVHAIHRDGGYSGKDLNRPGIQSVIADAQSHQIQKVVVYKLDRLSRSQKNTLYLIEDVFLENGVDFVSMTESLDTATPLGKAMIGILAVFAQLEREEIAERMMLGRIASAKEGNWRGGSGVPIGYRYIPKSATEPGRLVVDESEAVQVREVFRCFCPAGLTMRSIPICGSGIPTNTVPLVAAARLLFPPCYQIGRILVLSSTRVYGIQANMSLLLTRTPSRGRRIKWQSTGPLSAIIVESLLRPGIC